MKLFISSLIGGYETERAAVAHAATVLRWELLRAEDFGARPDSPQHACLSAVRAADVIVLVLGASYGVIQDSGLSATHEEWKEAVRAQKPILAFVESVERDERQREFVNEVQGWSAGRFRESFTTPGELQDKVTRALADLAGPGLADEADVARRAVAALPRSDRSAFGSGARLDVAVAGGPRQQVLRPAEIEDRALVKDLQREAMFGSNAPLDSQAATTPSVVGDHLDINQEGAAVVVHADGTVLVSTSVIQSRRRDVAMIPSVVEEDLREQIGRSLLFAVDVLDRIDSAHRVTDVVAAAALRDVNHLAWRTREEVAQNPGTASMNMASGSGTAPVTLTPALIRRAALTHDAHRIAEDLTVLLRRQRQ